MGTRSKTGLGCALGLPITLLLWAMLIGAVLVVVAVSSGRFRAVPHHGTAPAPVAPTALGAYHRPG